MKTVLFVDDEQEILDGLQVGMRRFRKRWKTHFATSGAAALELLEQHPVDVIVSDMRMPGMDGAALLEQVQTRHPGVLRIILSGYSEPAAALRVVPLAHQFVTKPSRIDELEALISRTCDLSEYVINPKLIDLVGRIESLPVIPRIYQQLTALLKENEVTATQTAELVRMDGALSSKLLQLANSAFFAPAMPIDCVKKAVVRLGFDVLKDLVLTAHIFSQAEQRRCTPGICLDSLQVHAARSARIARQLVSDCGRADQAATAALLHSLGTVVLATYHTQAYGEVLAFCQREGTPRWVAEAHLLGASQGQIGAYLLALWGLPVDIVQALALQHDPGAAATKTLSLAGVIHISSALAHEAEADSLASADYGLDLDYVNRLGLSETLNTWRIRAKGSQRSCHGERAVG